MKRENAKKEFKSKDTEFKKLDKASNKFVKFNRKDKDSKSSNERLVRKQNDPAFYTKYKALSENASRIAFSHRNGSPIQFAYAGNSVSKNIDPILVLNYVPIIGKSLNRTSGINVAANAAYKVLNRKYRGSPSGRYQTADLGIAQFAIMDFYLSLAQAERVYGLCQTARVNQLQVPRELIFTLGFDYLSISNDLANFRAHLNALIVRAQVLCLVKGYPFMDHHLFMLSNIFKDKDTARANYFAYHKPGYWLWNPTKFASGSALEWIQNRSSKYMKMPGGPAHYIPLQTADDVIYNLNNQLDALLTDSDIDAICADILALFENNGESDLLKLQFLPDGYNVEPIFAEEALYQLHNTVIPNRGSFGSNRTNTGTIYDVEQHFNTPYPRSILPTGETGSNHTGLFIYQIDDTISFDVVTTGSTATQIIEGVTNTYGSVSLYTYDVSIPVIDTDKLDPTPDEVIEMTRQTSIWYRHTVDVSGTNYYNATMATNGSVLVCNANAYTFTNVGGYSIDANGDVDYSATATVTAILSVMNINQQIAKFDWHPVIYMGQDIAADLDNYRGMDYPILYPIHNAALLSEFHNPISDILIKDI